LARHECQPAGGVSRLAGRTAFVSIWIGGTVTETFVADWDRVINVNLRGPFLCARAVLPGMVARHDRVIMRRLEVT
jgi:NAD(P)-dependent dehydrogenase (short-subunit alcohol dehydrogenase family)